MAAPVNFISFIPSQIGSLNQTPLQYTANPRKLLYADFILCFSKLPYVFGIILPWRFGSKGDKWDELYISVTNVKSIVLHAILVVAQSGFLISLPFFILFPVLWLISYLLAFWAFNAIMCLLLNGRTTKLVADKSIKLKKHHDTEYWIYMNGVSVGRDWLQSNIDRLSVTFGRRVNGVLNPTDGIVFDLIQCLVQRNLQYATNDIRQAYVSIKAALYDEKIKKVVFILHSQGGLEGSMIVDWLLAEVPQENLSRLEIFTFGNAANHFNNPSRHTLNPSHPLPGPALPKTTPEARVIGHIEHYANTGDYVSQVGVLHYARQKNRFMGRIFVSPNSGHLLNQHYLHQMFPLNRDGTCKDTNEFMEMPISRASLNSADTEEDERDGLSESMMYGGGEASGFDDDGSPVSSLSLSNASLGMTSADGNGSLGTMKVRNLSRLWLYRNGGVPPDAQVQRASTA